MTLVPHGDVEGNTREQTTLCDTESSTSNQETGIALHDTHEGCDNGPNNHDEGNPERRTRLLHHQVGRNFSENVEGEEDGKSDIVIETLEAKILLEGTETSVTNVGSIEERQEIEESEPGNQDQIDLAEKATGFSLAKRSCGSGVDIVDLKNATLLGGNLLGLMSHGEVRKKKIEA